MCLAVPGELLAIDATDPLMPMGRVSFGGVLKEVCLAYVPEARVGEFVIVHVGFALTVLDAEEAARIWATLETLEEPEAGEGP